jgi:hypothetical protein
VAVRARIGEVSRTQSMLDESIGTRSTSSCTGSENTVPDTDRGGQNGDHQAGGKPEQRLSPAQPSAAPSTFPPVPG